MAGAERKLDPVCQLNNGYFETNQGYRLCEIVLAVSYFKSLIRNSQRIISGICHSKKISFRSTEAIEEAGEKLYYELMIRCVMGGSDVKSSTLYISRAYNPNEVFVYLSDHSFSENVYLETLSTHVSIVKENYNFDNVEI